MHVVGNRFQRPDPAFGRWSSGGVVEREVNFVAFGVDLPVQRLMYVVNPMASLIASYRSILYGSSAGGPPGPPALDFFLRTAATSIIFFIAGYLFFAHRSKRFGEEV